ncbi:MAG TPA: BtpA/SgcQ family protein [Verrucomicrobiae bacterium]|nr:BtpA/SgcQ family protein [Verrucomicrobiae bacterium]
MPAKNSLFSSPKPVIAMIHLGALPGTPAGGRSVREIEALAVREAKMYRQAGVHGIMIENMHDTPYLRGAVGPEIVAVMSVVGRAVKDTTRLPCGVQVLAGANVEAVSVAHAAGLDFVRVEGFAFAHVADEGIIQSSAAPLLRFRKQIGAESVQVWADVKKKHSSHAITSDITVGETAEAVEMMRGDAVIITGMVTADPPALADIRDAKKHCRLPIYLGSGVTTQNLAKYFPVADGFIVGSHFKMDGLWSNTVHPKRVARFMAVHARLRS